MERLGQPRYAQSRGLRRGMSCLRSVGPEPGEPAPALSRLELEATEEIPQLNRTPARPRSGVQRRQEKEATLNDFDALRADARKLWGKQEVLSELPDLAAAEADADDSCVVRESEADAERRADAQPIALEIP